LRRTSSREQVEVCLHLPAIPGEYLFGILQKVVYPCVGNDFIAVSVGKPLVARQECLAGLQGLHRTKQI